MSNSSRTVGGNKLVAKLSIEDAEFLAGVSRTEHVSAGRILNGRQVWFPHSGLIALTITDQAGRSAQVGLVGSEGCLGLKAAFDAPTLVADAVVQIGGTMLTAPASVLRESWDDRPSLQAALSGWLVCMAAQATRTIACNRVHNLSSRTCRWLLTMRDRAGREDLPITQESLAQLLGGGRPRINRLLASLEAENLVSLRRGHIILANRPELEARACECYSTVKSYCARMAAATLATRLSRG
jgi:CRP-like cAMP-binding protein